LSYKEKISTGSAFENLILQLTKLEEEENPPAVISISYGNCYDIGVDGDKVEIKNFIEICKHIGVVTSKAGTTFFVSSGDGGATNSGRKDDGICGIYCQNAFATCPYVTAVGGTFGSEGGKEELSIGNGIGQGLNVVSGGGFSKIFTTENNYDLSFQAAAVNAWRQQPAAANSAPGYTNSDGTVGRGFPDVSAKSDNFLYFNKNKPDSSSGTSASSPMFAGIVNLCASQLPPDQVGFGWINPQLYLPQNQDLFYDIKRGNNQISAGNPAESCPRYDSFDPEKGDLCENYKFDITKIVNAYLRYDGYKEVGDKVFIKIYEEYSDKTQVVFVSRMVTKDELISFGYDHTQRDKRPLDFITIEFFDSDPDQGGSQLLYRRVPLSCSGTPRRWTINELLTPGLVLKGILAHRDEPDKENFSYKLFFDTFASREHRTKIFGFEATSGWDPASGLGTIGTSDPTDPTKGFRGLCNALLQKPFDFKKIDCNPSSIPSAKPSSIPSTDQSSIPSADPSSISSAEPTMKPSKNSKAKRKRNRNRKPNKTQ